MVTAVVVVAVIVALVIGSLVIMASWAMSAYILVEVYFSLFDIDVLIGDRNHLTNPLRRLVIELGVEVTVMESSDKDGDDLSFRDVRNRIPHLRKASDVVAEDL